MHASQFLGKAKSVWQDIAKVAAWLLVLTAAFVIPPPVSDIHEDKPLLWFGRFVLTVISGLMLVFMNRADSRPFAVRWAIAGAASITIATILFFANEYYRGLYSTNFHNVRVVIGTNLIPEAADDQKKHPQLVDWEGLIDYRGKVENVWPEKEVQANRRVFGEIYLALLVMSSLAVVLVVQALLCLNKK